MSTTTPNLGLTKPTPGGDDDGWDVMLNGNADILDAAVQDALDDAAAANSNANTRLLASLVSAFALTLLDDTSAAAMRTTMGAVGLTGNETVAGDKTFTGTTAATGGLTITSSPGGPTSGYVKLPAGMIMQWGLVTGGSGSATITFPIAFPTSCRSFVASIRDGGTAGNGVVCWITSGPTTSGATVVRRFSGGTAWGDAGGDIYWIAVGN